MKTQIRIHIDSREPFAGGDSFGTVGPYERLVGRVDFAVDPESVAYAGIVDIEHAPRNGEGLVEYSSDLSLLRPVDLDKGNRRLIYDVNNRGNKRVLTFFNDGTPTNNPLSREHGGNGFLMRRGYTLVWSGWQGDILPGNHRMTIRVPAATDNGRDITGPVRSELIASKEGVYSIPLSGNDFSWNYETASLDTSRATLTRRHHETDSRVPVSPDEWQFAMIDGNGNPTPSATHCYLPGGFRQGWIYELVYTARRPLVTGLGFTGIRDLVSYMLHETSDDDGTPNPVQDNGAGMEMAYSWGRSQCGRLLREFIYRGYNEDVEGRQVFAAISPTVSGGGRVQLNYRFAQPGRYPRQHEDHLYPSDEFPFAYGVTTDHHTGETDGILVRPDSDPLVMHTQTSSEYWVRRGSLVHTDTRGNNLPDHDRARVYLFASSQHSAIPGEGPGSGTHAHLSNPLGSTPVLRALLDAMDQWATDGTPPPDSVVPRREDETGVAADVAKSQFPEIPGVEAPAEANRSYVMDHGPEFSQGIMSQQPPVEDRDREYTVLVPSADGDGNEVAGIRTPDLEVPVATYTGWNVWPEGTADGAIFSIIGSYFPFPRNAEEREASGDSRLSVEERYRSQGHYVRAMAAAAQRLVEKRLLLEEDADRYVERAMGQKLSG